MAIGVIKNLGVVGIEEESTENTYIAPQAATSYVAPLNDGMEITPARELLDRDVMDGSVGKSSPKQGMKSVSASMPVELRGSGTEGAATDFDLLVKGALGATRAISTTTTTKASGNTATLLQIEDADISKFAVGDIIVTKGTGAHHVCVVTARATGAGVATLTVSPAHPAGDHADSVVISKSKMYYTANTGHPSLSISNYVGNTVVEKAIGCKVSGMSIDNYSTGQLASLNFSLEGLDFDRADGAAPHTPTLDSGTPPVILSATLYKDGTALQVNEFGLSVENTLAKITDFGSSSGNVSQRVSERVITGSLNPYLDDTSVANFTAFNAGTEFALFVRAYIPSSTAGEITMGSVVAIYLPKCVLTGNTIGDQDGTSVEQLEFRAGRGSDGSTEEMYMGFI